MIHSIIQTIQNDNLPLFIDSWSVESISTLPISLSFEVRGVRLPEISFLHYVILYRKPVFLEYFLENGFPPDQDVSNSRWTPLRLAVFLEYSELVEILVFYGANINISDKYGATPLSIAVLLGNSEIVKIILRSKIQINDFVNPLHSSIVLNNFEIFKILIESGANPNEKNLQGLTAFDTCKPNQLEILNYLNNNINNNLLIEKKKIKFN